MNKVDSLKALFPQVSEEEILVILDETGYDKRKASAILRKRKPSLPKVAKKSARGSVNRYGNVTAIL